MMVYPMNGLDLIDGLANKSHVSFLTLKSGSFWRNSVYGVRFSKAEIY